MAPMYCNDFVCSASLKNLNHFGDSSRDAEEDVGRGLAAFVPPLALPLRFRTFVVDRDLTLFGSSFRGFSGPLVG